jgi:hypothetical protein
MNKYLCEHVRNIIKDKIDHLERDMASMDTPFTCWDASLPWPQEDLPSVMDKCHIFWAFSCTPIQKSQGIGRRIIANRMGKLLGDSILFNIMTW